MSELYLPPNQDHYGILYGENGENDPVPYEHDPADDDESEPADDDPTPYDPQADCASLQM